MTRHDSDTRGLPRPDPRHELDTPNYQVLSASMLRIAALIRYRPRHMTSVPTLLHTGLSLFRGILVVKHITYQTVVLLHRSSLYF